MSTADAGSGTLLRLTVKLADAKDDMSPGRLARPVSVATP